MNQRGKIPALGWVAIVVGTLFALVCGIGVIGAAFSESDDNRATETVVNDPVETSTRSGEKTAPPVDTAKPITPRRTVVEDGLYHVGEDIPAATYRLEEAVTSGSLCYWRKSRDAEGEDIIDNDLAGVGRLQVTLKKGQWFESRNCGTWVKR